MNSILEKASHTSTATRQGLSLGWSDEMNGTLGGIGYGLASLNKNWNKTNENTSDAFKRGYIKYRDMSRKNILEAKKESPTLYTLGETLGTIATPARFTKARPNASLGVIDKTNLKDNIIGGIVSGVGNSENNVKSYLTNIGSSAFGGYVGHKTGNKILGRGALAPTTRSLVNYTIENRTKSTIDDLSDLQKKYKNK